MTNFESCSHPPLCHLVLHERIGLQLTERQLTVSQEPVVVRKDQFLLQEPTIDVAAGAAQPSPKGAFGRFSVSVQNLHIIQYILGIAAIEPDAVD